MVDLRTSFSTAFGISRVGSNLRVDLRVFAIVRNIDAAFDGNMA